MDKISSEARSRNMSRVKNANTNPELVVRKLLHGMGYRFRLHNKQLPGTPDITLPRYKTAVFVHGCFWHGHSCPRGRRPSSRIDFWNKKLDTNAARDQHNYEQLTLLGWRTLIVWECELKNPQQLQERLSYFLSNDS